MKTFILTDEQWDKLETELISLHGYHWNDDHIHANDCGSQVLDILEDQVYAQKIQDSAEYII